MTSRKQDVLNALVARGTNLTTKQIGDITGAPQSSIRRILVELKDEGKVKRVYGAGMKTWQALVEASPAVNTDTLAEEAADDLRATEEYINDDESVDVDEDDEDDVIVVDDEDFHVVDDSIDQPEGSGEDDLD